MNTTNPAPPPVDPAATAAAPMLPVDPEAQQKAKAKQAADVKKWLGKVEQARKFDEEARKQYARDRRYARGDSGFEVDANIVGTNIDILEAFLYARDPDIDVRPSVAAEPPSLASMRDAADDHVSQLPDLQMAWQQAHEAVFSDSGGDQVAAMKAGDAASDGLKNYLVEKQFKKTRDRYQRRQRDNKAFAETLEIIVSRMWKDARLKARGVRWVRSALTIGLGVIKASWQERTAPSPETVTAINDLQADIKRAALARQNLDEANGAELDAQMAEYQRQLTNLTSQMERVVARGFVVDLVPAEDFQVAPGYIISDHLDAPWNSHRIPMRYCDAQAEFELPDEVMRKATRYSAKKPKMIQRESAMVLENIEASDADSYATSSDPSSYSAAQVGEQSGDFVMLEEIWDRDTNSVLTGIHGIDQWVKPAWQPTATTRFYPFFVYTTSEVDGQRHPQSLVSRSAKLVDEYNRIGSSEAEHRRRVRPKTAFNAGMMSPADAKKLEGATTQEMVGINPTQPNAKIGDILAPVTYAAIDQALYDRQRIVNELERIWGIQEALSGSIDTAKTATEASIQDRGFNARTGGRRDMLEMVMGDLAEYTAEMSRAHVTIEDAQAITGPDAMWPEYAGPNDLSSLVNVSIRAGSSGKPDTAAERQAWANQLPLLQQAIVQIGQLRQSSPLDIADALERLLKITAERSGDRIDIDSLVPQASDAPEPPAPGAMAGPGGQPPPGTPPGGAPPPGQTAPGAPLPAAPAATPPVTA